jgi:hypothetical protein
MNVKVTCNSCGAVLARGPVTKSVDCACGHGYVHIEKSSMTSPTPPEVSAALAYGDKDYADTVLAEAHNVELPIRHWLTIRAHIATLEARLAEAGRDAGLAGSYLLPDGVSVERVDQRHGKSKWAVRRFGDCMSVDGVWGYEPLPSNRSDDWLASHRFDTHRAAIDAALSTSGAKGESDAR